MTRSALSTSLLLAALFAVAPGVARAAAPRDASAPSLRRFALVASSNDGGAGRIRLRFADSDATSVARVLGGLGGVRDPDLVMVRDTNRARLRAGFDRMKTLLGAGRRPGVRDELFVYYSGHSDEDGLLLAGERVGYRELRGWIEEMGADVKIAILDSCASGALIRLKGGSRVPPFLSDVSTHARGHAFLTASSADEAAQESDRIGAAFFTHYLVSGLRGAADANRDRRVTLNEAYHFAYAETLRRTETSRGGPQHAAYDIQLAGTGDLVMTDLRTPGARLVFPQGLAGRLYVRDGAGRLLVELRKEPLYPVEIGLEAGSYRVVLDSDGRPFEARVELRDGVRAELAQAAFRPLPSTMAVSRGGAVDTAIASAPERREYRWVAADLVLAPGLRLTGRSRQPVLNNFVLGVIGDSDALRGVQLSLVANIVRDQMRGVQLASGMNLLYGDGRGAQVGALANVAVGSWRGLQMGTVNLAGSDVVGAQIAVVNAARGGITGAQLGVVNAAPGRESRAFQVGVANAVRGLEGAQIGVVNVGGAVSGAQIGVVNVATEGFKGLQLGVVNYAGRGEGASFGLLPIVRDGYNRVAIWSSDVSFTNVGVKLGTQHVYTLLGVGMAGEGRGRDDGDESTPTATAGFGFHAKLGARLFLDVDLTTMTRWEDDELGGDEQLLTTARATLGWQLAQRLAVTLGPTFNVALSFDGEDHRPGSGVGERTVHEGDTTVRLFPGFSLGLQI